MSIAYLSPSPLSPSPHQSGQFNEDMIPTVGFNMRKITKGNVTIKVGQSFIAIESGGISIGTTGTIDMSDQSGLTLKSQAQATLQSPQTTVKGDAMVTVKGGMVAIN